MTAQTMTVHNELRSWVDSANGHSDFSLANLPLGVFSRDGDQPRGGVAVGDYILDLAVACEAGLLEGSAAEAAKAASASSLNTFFAARRCVKRCKACSQKTASYVNACRAWVSRCCSR
jgi:fumarylacetoacetase